MPITMNVAEAKAKLSSLIERAEAGEEVTIARAGRPVVRLVPVTGRPKRQAGLLKHWVWTDSDALLKPLYSEAEWAEIEAEWARSWEALREPDPDSRER
jgi:prevent-host-death family protein